MDRRHSKFCALAVVLSAAFSTMPLLQPYFFASSDGLFHLYRLMEYDLLLKSGVWYPRWAPDFFFGSGMPLFNYYAPLTYYLAEVFRFLGAGYLDSLRLFVVISMVLSGIGAWLYARTFFSPLSSLLAAIVYMYAPYHIVNLYYRGDIAEYAAYTWFPFILWAMTRLLQRKTCIYLFAGSVFYAGLILTHNLSAFIFSGFLMVYGLAALLRQHLTGQRGWRELGVDALRLSTLAAAALALSAFFWAPALAEKSLMSFDRLLAALNFHEHFPTVEQLFSMDLIHRYGVVFRSAEVFGYRLGVLQALFLTLGLVLLIRERRRLVLAAKAEAVASVVVTAIALFFIFPISAGIWESLPLLNLTQFPWRFLAFIALPSAFLAGLSAQALSKRLRTLVVLVLAPAVIVSSVGAMFPIMSNVTEAQVTPKGSITFELMTGGIGTTAAAEYLPRWVQQAPSSTPYALAKILDEPTTGSSSRSTNGVEAVQFENSGGQSTYRVRAAKAGAFVPNLVYFPGWVAYVDGKEVPTSIDDPSGLIKLEVPEGEHVASFRFQDTPLRRFSNLVSLAALLVLGGLLLWRYRQALVAPMRWLPRPSGVGANGRSPLRERLGIPFPLVTRERLARAAILLALAPVWLASKSTYDSVYTAAAVYGSPLVANLDGEVMTAGYTLSGLVAKSNSQAQVSPGSSIDLTLFWRRLGGDTNNRYRPFIRLTNRFDQTWAYAGASEDQPEPDAGREDMVATTFHLAVPVGTPPGAYEIEIGFDNTTTRKLLEVRRVWIVPVLPSYKGVRIGPLVVGRGPSSGPSGGQALAIQESRYLADPVSFGEDLRLLDLSVANGEAMNSGRPGLALPREAGSGLWQSRAGEIVHIDLLWQARRKMAGDVTITARLAGADHNLWAIRDSQPADGTYPTSFWAPGEVIRDQLDITVPPETPPGTYELQIEVVTPKGSMSIIGENGAPVGPTLRAGNLSILPSARTARLSDLKVQRRAEAPVLDGLDIIGYSLGRPELKPGEQLSVDLIWRASKAVGRDLVARLELVSPSDKPLATDTRRLVGDAYPTTAWRQGEVLRGKYSLRLSARASDAAAGLRVTLMDAKSGDALGHVDLDRVRILPRTRLFAAIPSRPLRVDFGNKVRLLGYDITADQQKTVDGAPKVTPSGVVGVSLYWQDIAEMDTSFTVFVQVLNSAGRLVAQHDSPPQGGGAPTTAWIPGEVVVDEHRIAIPATLPAGDYTIIAGIYDLVTGKRLLTEGGDYVALTRLLVFSKG